VRKLAAGPVETDDPSADDSVAFGNLRTSVVVISLIVAAGIVFRLFATKASAATFEVPISFAASSS
jgi:hypothetical protein